MPCSFPLGYEIQIQRKWTHYGVSIDVVAYMNAMRSSTSSILLQYPTPLLYSTIGQLSIQ